MDHWRGLNFRNTHMVYIVNSFLYSFPDHIAQILTARKICVDHSKPSILILVHTIGYILSLKVNLVCNENVWNVINLRNTLFATLIYNMCEFASKNIAHNRYCLAFYKNC